MNAEADFISLVEGIGLCILLHWCTVLEEEDTVRRHYQWRSVQPTPESPQISLRRHSSKLTNRKCHFLSFSSSTSNTHLWISSATLLPLHSWRAHLDFYKLEESLKKGRRWPMPACNPVNCSLAFLITFLWTWIYTAIVECISLYHHHFKIELKPFTRLAAT